jgi:hypothetical protein
MIEVVKGIFVGDNDAALYGWKQEGEWAFVHACKEPWHRQFVGYVGRGAPKDSPEFYYAIRNREIALNIVDVDNPEWFNIDMIKMAIGFIAKYSDNYNVLIHCNQGESRSPSIAMLYLATTGVIPNTTFFDAELEFMKRYKFYNPKQGIRQHLIQNWAEYTLPG